MEQKTQQQLDDEYYEMLLEQKEKDGKPIFLIPDLSYALKSFDEIFK